MPLLLGLKALLSKVRNYSSLLSLLNTWIKNTFKHRYIYYIQFLIYNILSLPQYLQVHCHDLLDIFSYIEQKVYGPLIFK